MKEKEAVAIQKIDIKIGQKTLSLTPEQAKELKQILNDMFEEKVVHEHHHHSERYWWNWPTYSSMPAPLPYEKWTITCGGISNPISGLASTAYNSGDVTLCLNSG